MQFEKLSEDQKNIRIDLFMKFAGHMDTLLLENQKAFDQAILTLSSGAVAALLVFVQSKQVIASEILFFSADAFFLIAIIVTIFSFLTAQQVVQQKTENARKYYLEGDEQSATKELPLEKITKCMHFAAALSFILGVVFTILFITNNIQSTGEIMSENKNQFPKNEGTANNQTNRVPDSREIIKNGYTGPSMTLIPTAKPAPSGNTQPTPTQVPSANNSTKK